MASSISQQNFCDTTPLSLGNCGTDGTGIYFPLTFPNGTSAGSTLEIFAGHAPVGSGTITGASDVVNGSYGSALQTQLSISGGNASWYCWVKQNASAVGAGFYDRATSVSTTTLGDTGAAWTTNQWAGNALIDLSSNRTYTVVSNTATVLTFASGTAPTANCFFVVGAFVRISLSASATAIYYCAGAAVEVINAAASGGVVTASGLTTTAGSGASNVSSGTAACGSSPGLMIAMSVNALGNSTPYVPIADTGNGFTDLGAFFTDDNGQTTLRLESKHFSGSPGTVGATFGSHGVDQFGSFMVFVQDATGGATLPLGQICL